jgi:hypothetical protein
MIFSSSITKACIRSIPSGYGLCSLFVPGDRHVVLGTKKGTLQIFDLVKMLENFFSPRWWKGLVICHC